MTIWEQITYTLLFIYFSSIVYPPYYPFFPLCPRSPPPITALLSVFQYNERCIRNVYLRHHLPVSQPHEERVWRWLECFPKIPILIYLSLAFLGLWLQSVSPPSTCWWVSTGMKWEHLPYAVLIPRLDPISRWSSDENSFSILFWSSTDTLYLEYILLTFSDKV